MSHSTLQPKPNVSELGRAVATCRSAFAGVWVASFLVNLLTLTGSIYMLQVYDRVIPSRSSMTLLGLTAILIFLYAAYGFFDVVRGQLLSGIGMRLDRLLRARAFAIQLMLPLRARRNGAGPQPLRDLDQIRSFVSGLGPTALFDLPWLPLFLGFVYLLHPLLGLLATMGAALIVALTLLTEFLSRHPMTQAGDAAARRHTFTEAARRNSEVVWALGMRSAITDRWSMLSRQFFEEQEKAARIAAILGTVSRVLRLLLQSCILGLGAYLVIHQEATGGVMIAASIMTSRALAPVEVAIANWKSFITARQSYGRLKRLLAAAPPVSVELTLPKPEKSLSVEALVVGAPGEQRALIQDVSFSVVAGAGVGVIGPSAAGKSTLARALVGVWLPARGTVRLDGSALDHWEPEDLGKSIGYLPQDIELFEGSIAANIARFASDANTGDVIAAAKAAGVHDMIARMPDGYGTKIGEGGCALSAGQRQRIALARALYGDPFLVVLDEPNSNLDTEGEEALSCAIRSVRERGGIVVVIAHRPSALAAVDQVLVMANGRAAMFGPREEVLRKALRDPGLVSPNGPSQPASPATAAPLVRAVAANS